jgi:hypothetical protein
LFATGNTNYVWLSNPSACVCCRAVEQAYATLGVSDYSSIDYARWTAWWGTGKPVFPIGKGVGQ